MLAPETPVVHTDPEIMSGTPVFVGTRVPFQALLDYLEAGQPLSEFLADFPSVSKEQAVAALEQAKEALLERARPAVGSGTASLDWSRCPVAESVPGKVSGAWVLRGTRMPVATIFENLEAGANLDDILEWYDGLEREQVKAVIDFAARSLDTQTPGR
jgi:uncharacterized protein (DUF433 family)